MACAMNVPVFADAGRIVIDPNFFIAPVRLTLREAMALLMGVPLKVATATSTFMIGVTGTAGAYIQYVHGLVDPTLTVPVVVGVIGGALLGPRVARRLRRAEDLLVARRVSADAVTAAGFTVERSQIVLDRPIKTLGMHRVRVMLHPEVGVTVTANVPQVRDAVQL